MCISDRKLGELCPSNSSSVLKMIPKTDNAAFCTHKSQPTRPVSHKQRVFIADTTAHARGSSEPADRKDSARMMSALVLVKRPYVVVTCERAQEPSTGNPIGCSYIFITRRFKSAMPARLLYLLGLALMKLSWKKQNPLWRPSQAV